MTDNSSINRYVHVDATNPSALLAEDTEARAQITALKEEVASLLEMVVAESKRLDEKVLHVASTLMVIHGNVTSRIARAEQMLGIVIPE